MTVYAYAADGTRSIVVATDDVVEDPTPVAETPEADEAPAPAKRAPTKTTQKTADPVVTDEPVEGAS